MNYALLVLISANSAIEIKLDKPASINYPDILHLHLILCKVAIECTCTDITIAISGVSKHESENFNQDQ